ncbi:histidine kinase dimerization/phosphoacceptor domain-containing protein [Arthrobacter sp. USHLN218]|uniref:histidine kinase dimerization/phosphoacceptor domain-containing protein n=1 Tax=Arthrobacter sp. USHLN218 TaxID=3081232 RepID=UPI0030171358
MTDHGPAENTCGLTDARPAYERIDAPSAAGKGEVEELGFNEILERLLGLARSLCDAGYGLLDFGAAAGTASDRFITSGNCPEWPVVPPEGTGQILHIAIRAGNAIVRMSLGGKPGGGVFTGQERERVESLAELAGAAIGNAWRRKHWLDVSMELPKQISDAPEKALELIAAAAREAAAADLVMAAVPAASGLRFEAVTGTGCEPFPGDELTVPPETVETLMHADGPLAFDALDLLGSGFPCPDHCLTIRLDLAQGPAVLMMCRTTEAGRFSPVDVDMAAMFSRQATIGTELTEKRRLHEHKALADERERVARDRTDTAIQRLFAAGLGLQGLNRLAPDENSRQRIAELITELDQTILELRETIYSPAPNA